MFDYADNPVGSSRVLGQKPQLFNSKFEAAFAGLLITLAWMSIQASVTLAAILTVILLPWAAAKARGAPICTALAVALVGMTWEDFAPKVATAASGPPANEKRT
jgi:hypothetical protein